MNWMPGRNDTSLRRTTGFGYRKRKYVLSKFEKRSYLCVALPKQYPFPSSFTNVPLTIQYIAPRKRKIKKNTQFFLLKKPTFLSSHNLTYYTSVLIHRRFFVSSTSAVDAHGGVRGGEALLDGDAHRGTPAIDATPGSRVTAWDITGGKKNSSVWPGTKSD